MTSYEMIMNFFNSIGRNPHRHTSELVGN